MPLLSTIVFVPLIGALLVLALASRPQVCRWTALTVAVAELLLTSSLGLLPVQKSISGKIWWRIEGFPWIERLGIHFSLGLDGLSFVLIMLTALIGILCVLVSWKQITDHVAAFHAAVLLTLTGVMGVFLATDLFLFYLFWEIQTLPMFFLVGIWGHEHRRRAALKFMLFTLAGSLVLLGCLITVYVIHGAQTGLYTFALDQLAATPLTATTELLLFTGFVLAFAIKIPVFPVHVWLPDTHTEAPTAGSVILAGLLLKTGVYAVLRIAFPLFPLAARASAPWMLVLGLIGLFYAAWIALAQRDIKRLVAYSSIAHMGLVVVGLATWESIALTGAMLQMVNHGISTTALFILVGMLSERIETRNLDELGGLWKKMPFFGAFFLFFAMASIGLPGLNNFVGELLILVGLFTVHPVPAALGFFGLAYSVFYALTMLQKALYGEVPSSIGQVWDLTQREMLILGLMAVVVLAIGLHPQPILGVLKDPVQQLLSPTAHLAGL